MGMSHGSVAPDAVTYGAAITACAKSNQADVALELLSNMRKRHCRPETSTYNSAANACSILFSSDVMLDAGWHNSLGLLTEMSASALEPDAISFWASISSCGLGDTLDQWKRA